MVNHSSMRILVRLRDNLLYLPFNQLNTQATTFFQWPPDYYITPIINMSLLRC